jgi:hypothetical protein
MFHCLHCHDEAFNLPDATRPALRNGINLEIMFPRCASPKFLPYFPFIVLSALRGSFFPCPVEIMPQHRDFLFLTVQRFTLIPPSVLAVSDISL